MAAPQSLPCAIPAREARLQEPERAPRLRSAAVSGLHPVFGSRSSDPGRSWTHFACCVAVVHCFPGSCCERRRLRPEPVDPAQDLDEQGAGHRHLGQLEHDVAAMAYDPGADLHELLAQGRQRPMLDLLGQGQRAQEVGEIVGERVQLEAYRVVAEGVAGQPRPADRILAFLT
jgi:hypothetical protein